MRYLNELNNVQQAMILPYIGTCDQTIVSAIVYACTTAQDPDRIRTIAYMIVQGVEVED